MNDKLDGRRCVVWRGQDPVEDINALADAVADSGAELFDLDGRLVWLNEGKLVRVNKDVLPQ